MSSLTILSETKVNEEFNQSIFPEKSIIAEEKFFK